MQSAWRQDRASEKKKAGGESAETATERELRGPRPAMRLSRQRGRQVVKILLVYRVIFLLHASIYIRTVSRIESNRPRYSFYVPVFSRPYEVVYMSLYSEF